MGPSWRQYLIPRSLDEALRLLREAPRPLALIAGGTDLLLDLEQGRHAPVHTLVDVSQIPELRALEVRGDRLFIGAGVTHHELANSPLVRRHATALAEASSHVAGPQVRRVATIGGNVAHALPAADGTIALTVLDAVAEVASPQGTRRVAFEELFAGPGRSTLAEDEILVGFYLPLAEGNTASAFARVMRPQTIALPVLNAAAWVRREGERLADVRLTLGPSGPVPRRLRATEAVLRGQPLTDDVLAHAYDQLLQEARFRTSRLRATKAYRQHLAYVLMERVLRRAFDRCAEPQMAAA